MAIGTGTYDRELATRLARRAVAMAAPEELPQFELTARAFHSAPEHLRFGGGSRAREPLGLGLETVAALLGTVALAAAVQVLDHWAQQAAGHVADTARHGLLSRLRRLRRRGEPEEQPVAALPSREPLTAAQLAELRRVARETALRLRVSEDAARAIADGIVAELAAATGQPGPGADSRPEPGAVAEPLVAADPDGTGACVGPGPTTVAATSPDADADTGSVVGAAGAGPTPGPLPQARTGAGDGGASVDANEPDGPAAAPNGAGAAG
ncbi:hypothetical protein ACFY8C_31015 [Streptomyces flavochromogenes]|uniref:Uncharacterized protein n=1 Tax=Streptomyces flavochromogenes TaxID=68199 RepID=A0ABW6XYY6_9ACTN|nr:hypothetical protein [Streptomyces flavochromogenes]